MHQDLCGALLSAGIPFAKLENQRFRSFLETYTGKTIPSENTMRTKYLPVCYEDVMKATKEELKTGSMWISVDCAKDTMGREVANILVGKLDNEQFHKPILVKVAFMDTADSASTARLLNDALRMIDPNLNANRVRVLLSDAAPYMIKCGKSLKVFFPRLLHLTCTLHGISLVCEKAMAAFPDVNRLIASVKMVFVKAPSRRAIYRESCPDLPLPPEPIVTR